MALTSYALSENALSRPVAQALLRHAFDKVPYAPPTTLWCGLHPVTAFAQTALSAGAPFFEPEPRTDNGYHRVAVDWERVDTRTVTNASDVVFPVPIVDLGAIAGFALYDAPVGGNYIARAIFNYMLVPIPAYAGKKIYFPAGTLDFTWDALNHYDNGVNWCGFSDYLADKLNGLLFLHEPFPCPDVYLGVAKAEVTRSDTVATITECDAADYFRFHISPSSESVDNPQWYFDEMRYAMLDVEEDTEYSPGEVEYDPVVMDGFLFENWGWLRGFYVDAETPGTGNILAHHGRFVRIGPDAAMTTARKFYSMNNKAIHVTPSIASVEIR